MRELKKISLRSVSEFLTEPEMKRVTGGYGSGTCCWHSTTSCDCRVSKTEALFMAGCDSNGENCGGGGWCCDSCGTSTWAERCGYS